MRVRGVQYRDEDDAYEHAVQSEIDNAMFPEVIFNEAAHTYTVNGVRYPSVTEVVGMLRPESGARQDVIEYKRQIGKALHKAVELYEGNDLDPDSLDPVVAPYFEGWVKFKRDVGFEMLHSEMIVASTKLRVAGTLDLVGMRAKLIELLDLKAVWTMGDETAIQTAGYSMLYEEMTGVKVDRRAGLQLLRDGTYRYHQYKDANDRNVFLACLSVHNWKALHR